MTNNGIVFPIAAVFLLTACATIPDKQVQVTAETIAIQPAGKPYVIDLTLDRTTYNLAADIDFSRVRLRTSKGEIAMGDVIKQLGTSGKLVVGTLSDIRGQKLDPPLVGGTSQIHSHQCGAIFCTCDNAGCTLLLLEGKCVNDKLVCDVNFNCVCIKKAG